MEYKVLETHAAYREGVEVELNELATDGWRVVSVVPGRLANILVFLERSGLMQHVCYHGYIGTSCGLCEDERRRT